MNIILGFLVIAAATGLAITVMLLVRRNAPDGGYFNDGDRAAGVFGVLATGFSVLLGFIIFLAFSSYDQSRVGAEEEALAVIQQVETAQLFEPALAAELTGGLVCYARSVVGPEWDRMEDGTLGEHVNPWGIRLFETIAVVEPETPREEAAYSKWLDQTSAREQARNDRVHGAVGVIPVPLWVVLFFVAGLIFVFMMFFADRGERSVVQAMLIGTVVAIIVAMLLLLQFLDSPFKAGVGGLRPVAMERSLIVIDEALRIEGLAEDFPCDSDGTALDQ